MGLCLIGYSSDEGISFDPNRLDLKINNTTSKSRKKNAAIKHAFCIATECYYCGRNFKKHALVKVVEHFVPISKGGSNHNSNKTISCKTCDDWKEAKSIKSFIRDIKGALIFNRARPQKYNNAMLLRMLRAIELFDILH